MKKMSEIFELPIKHANLPYLLDRTDYEEDAAIINVINHVDALADALEALVNDIENNINPRYSFESAVAALAAYRGER